jgi:hypothetical protein
MVDRVETYSKGLKSNAYYNVTIPPLDKYFMITNWLE